MMFRKRRILLPLVCGLLLVACAAAPHTQYFGLSGSSFIPPPGQISRQTAVQVVLAEPLNQGGLVYQTDAHRLNIARHNVWAAPLEQSLAALFSNRLNRHGSFRFIPYGRRNGLPVLKIYIERFQGAFDGKVSVGGYAQWPEGRSVPFNILVPQRGNGYAAMVEALAFGAEQAADMVGEAH